MNNFWLMLLGMTAITFLCRYFFFARSLRFNLPPKLQKLLGFTAPAVLTAMWSPIVFLGHGGTTTTTLLNPFLLAGLITIALSLLIKNTLTVVVLAMLVFSGLSWWL